MSKISDLVIRYLDRDTPASDGAITEYTCTSAGTVRTAVCTGLSALVASEIVGALVRWNSGSNGTANQWGAVNAFNGSDTLTFDTDLPYTVGLGDKFTLIKGGKFITNQRIPGLISNGFWPPYNPSILSTSLTITYIAMLNGVGNGLLSYNGTNGQATWQPPGGTAGPGVTLTSMSTGATATLVGGGTDITEKSKFIIVSVTAGSLPGTTSQTLALTIPKGVHMMPLTGTETQSGVTIYRPVGVINTNATDAIYNLKAFVPNPFTGTASSTVAVGSGGIGVGAATLVVTDTTNWPLTCWVGRVVGGVINDCRYCYDKSGNSYSVMNPGGGMRGYAAGVWAEGDSLTLMPWQDIGLNAPSSTQFANPATESTVPAGVTFSTPMSDTNGLQAGDIAANGIYCVWERFYVPANMRPVSNLIADLRIYAEVDQE